jgi:hypothetical protein
VTPAEKAGAADAQPFEMKFDISTIKHLGLQMYSTLPPVIGELVSNAWDANAKNVSVTIPTDLVTDASEIVVIDDGDGMTEKEIREAYLVVGRDRRKATGTDTSGGTLNRALMGRKGIGKFSGFGIAGEVEIETAKDGTVSRFKMNYADLEAAADKRTITFPPLAPTGTVTKGTKVTLRRITKFRTHRISVEHLRRGLARRFSVIGTKHKFNLKVNGKQITVAERDLRRLVETGTTGGAYLWEYEDEQIAPPKPWTVTGWIGALERTTPLEDGVQRGIAILARGKLVQEPFVFDATVGQQFALSYLVGELHAEFVDEAEDTIGTTRNSLVWDTEANAALLAWGKKEVNRIAREWAERRSNDNESALQKNPLYRRFQAEAGGVDNKRALKVADKLIKDVISRNVLEDVKAQEEVVQLCIDFLEFDAFWELAEEITDAGVDDASKLLRLFREWEIVEAKEMARVTKGRITTIEKLQELIAGNALEVPTLHKFLKEFPWVLDPRWNLIADEAKYSKLLAKKFPDGDKPEKDRRIDFLCVRENQQMVVVEIKRPQSKASVKELDQIEQYVHFMRDLAESTTDPDFKMSEVVGYLLCGDVVNTGPARQKVKSLANDKIYVRRYSDLLGMVEKSHSEFLKQYDRLRRLKQDVAPSSSSATPAKKTSAVKKKAATKAAPPKKAT